jgi:hypothetical protein
MGITLEFTTTDDRQGKAEYDCDVTVINLEGKSISTIDLTPLNSCTKLKTLNLQENKLKRLDLTPLRTCKALREFQVDRRVVQDTFLGEEHFENVRFRHELKFNVPVRLPSLDAISDVFPLVGGRDPAWKTVHMFHEVLSILNLGWIGLLDIEVDLMESLLRSILTDAQKEHARELMRERATPLIINQIESGGTTIGLEPERLGEAATRIDRVAELRREEMSQVILHEYYELKRLLNSIIDLRPLWLTAYGHQVLTVLGLGTRCISSIFESLKAKLESDLGYELQTTDDEDLKWPTAISEPLREYIWKIADFNARIGVP